jgi:hypothetical protein
MILSTSISGLREKCLLYLGLDFQCRNARLQPDQVRDPFHPFVASCRLLGSRSLIIPVDLSFERYPYLTTAWMPFQRYCSCAFSAETTSRAIPARALMDQRQADLDIVRYGQNPGHTLRGCLGLPLLTVTAH